MPWEAFDDLIAANLADQHVSSYPDGELLMGYCALSAIGRLVLAVFEVPVTAELLQSRSGSPTASGTAWSTISVAASPSAV